MTPNRELEGRVALVTGAARNIGRAIAVALADAGASVMVAARTSAADAEATAEMVVARGGRAAVFLGDLADPAVAADAVAASVSRLGRLDILVNNAAARADNAIGDINPDEWRRIVGSILDAGFFCSQAALPFLKASDLASIVMIGGVAGHAGVAHRAHVAAAKAGVAGLARALAEELAESGITVNCIAPGRIETDRRGPLPLHFQRRPVPVGRGGRPEEIAALVRYLAGPSGRFITGQIIHVNGGWHMGG
jgi:3-oxoacyl-[acyl-carrier protein] reductase